ncbi:RNA polymerase beta subunit, partial (chloroplast), partial [Olea europaea subsp. europaea]
MWQFCQDLFLSWVKNPHESDFLRNVSRENLIWLDNQFDRKEGIVCIFRWGFPKKDGLFCERIFGPIKNGICACGNYRVIGDEKEDPKFSEQCGDLDSTLEVY